MSQHRLAQGIQAHQDARLAYPQTQAALAGERWRGSCMDGKPLRHKERAP